MKNKAHLKNMAIVLKGLLLQNLTELSSGPQYKENLNVI